MRPGLGPAVLDDSQHRLRPSKGIRYPSSLESDTFHSQVDFSSPSSPSHSHAVRGLD